MPSDRPWTAHYDQGVPANIEYPKKPLFHFLEESARKYPNRACTIFQGAVISYRQMNEITDRVAAALAGLGVKKGDRVGIFMPNTPQFVMAYFGILKAGAVVVATNPLYTAPEIAYQAGDADVEIMFVMAGLYRKIKTAQPGTKIRQLIVTGMEEALPPLGRMLLSLTRDSKSDPRPPGRLQDGDVWMKNLIASYVAAQRPKLDLQPEDTVLFQYSGGTTGVSKGAVASHSGAVANTIQLRTWLVTAEQGKERVLMCIPMFHAYGMIVGMCLGMSLGASLIVVPNPRDIPGILRAIDKYRPSIFPGVPTLFTAINNHPDVVGGNVDLRSIKACISGSTPLLRDTKEMFESLSGARLFEGYGLSEAPVATHLNPLLGANKTGSIGMPLPDVECRVVSLDDGETELAPGQIGELVIRAPQVMKGYHNMPTETANSLRALSDGRTWLFTGDIARMDKDGYFYIVDRKKELIKAAGFQVWPREVEEVIATNPKVLEVGVAGIPDPIRGETVKAWIILKPGQQITPEELKAWCKDRLAPYKVPTHYEFRTELPKTSVGKILRRELVRQHKELEPPKA
jgi:long-chain acyl-CoA synthetase